MLLSNVFENISYTLLHGHTHINISCICCDSREVSADSMFVAITGFSIDGHRYVDAAIKKGATAIVVEKDIGQHAGVTIIQVSNTRAALAKIAANFYEHPTQHLPLIGVTGTNGKTSTTFFLQSIFKQTNTSVGIIGTIGTTIGDRHVSNKNTTPESLQLQQIFAEMRKVGIECCMLEVSSHALMLERVTGCYFNIGIFTNLSPDHLEFHSTMAQYFEAKARLFTMTTDYNIINADDIYGEQLIRRLSPSSVPLCTYGIEKKADVYATDIRYEEDCTIYTVHTPKANALIKVNLPGIIYVYNSLAAIATAYCYGIHLNHIADGIAAVDKIKGRLEVVYQDDFCKVIVDFAHTEDSLMKALTTVRPFVKGRLLLVFGVYASDDEAGFKKRSAMGRIAATHADLCIVTSDNPKEQNNHIIIQQISAGVAAYGGNFKTIIDRQEAIEYAMNICQKHDVVLIAGKGHETSQIIGTNEIPFHEAEIVHNALNKLKHRSTSNNATERGI